MPEFILRLSESPHRTCNSSALPKRYLIGHVFCRRYELGAQPRQGLKLAVAPDMRKRYVCLSGERSERSRIEALLAYSLAERVVAWPDRQRLTGEPRHRFRTSLSKVFGTSPMSVLHRRIPVGEDHRREILPIM